MHTTYSKARYSWLGSKIYASTEALSSTKRGDLLTWRLADAHPLKSQRQAIALFHAQELVGYLEDRYVGTFLKAKNEFHIHITVFRLKRGMRVAKVIFYPRNPITTEPPPPDGRAAPPPEPRLPYID